MVSWNTDDISQSSSGSNSLFADDKTMDNTSRTQNFLDIPSQEIPKLAAIAAKVYEEDALSTDEDNNGLRRPGKERKKKKYCSKTIIIGSTNRALRTMKKGDKYEDESD